MENEEILIKMNTVLSQAVQLITQEYPNKFWSAEKINGSIKDNIITITGNLDIFDSEVYEKTIDFKGKEDHYKIILRSVN